MDTFELQYIVDRSPLIGGLHTRVLAKDQLPKQKLHYVRAFIVNTDKSSEPGEHWVVIYFRGNTAFYFDSYGLPPPTDYIEPFMLRHARQIIWNHRRLQSVDYAVCGMYCIYALDGLARGYTMEQLVSIRFGIDHVRNDKTVLRWFCQNYDVYLRAAQKGGQCCRSERIRDYDPLPTLLALAREPHLQFSAV